MVEDIRVWLASLRVEHAENLKRLCPEWNGESFPTWRDYPALPEDAPKHLVGALAVVMVIDASVSQPKLGEEIRFWAQVISILQNRDDERELIKKFLDGPRKAREEKKKLSSARKAERQKIAEDALKKFNHDEAKAAKSTKKSVKTLNRWRDGK